MKLEELIFPLNLFMNLMPFCATVLSLWQFVLIFVTMEQCYKSLVAAVLTFCQDVYTLPIISAPLVSSYY